MDKVKKPSLKGSTYNYLGHFRKEEHLCRGHNTDGKMKFERIPGANTRNTQSDTPREGDTDAKIDSLKISPSGMEAKIKHIEPRSGMDPTFAYEPIDPAYRKPRKQRM